MFVCLCKGVTDRAIRASIASGATTVEAVGEACGAGTGCGGCVKYVVEMLEAAGAPADRTETDRGDVA